MFKLMKLDTNKFRVIQAYSGVDCEGTKDEMFEVMSSLGVQKEQLDRAISEFELKGTNCADFGIGMDQETGPMFLFSDTRTIERVVGTGPQYRSTFPSKKQVA